MRSLTTLFLLFLVLIPGQVVFSKISAEPGLPLEPSWTSTGVESGEQHGMAVGIDGDFNGDGWNDLFVGAPRAKVVEDREGVVYVYHGSITGLPNEPFWTKGSGQQGAYFGGAVASVGDVNNDGADDLLVGAPAFGDKETPPTKQGAAYLYQGGMYGLADTPSWSYYGGQQGASLGSSVSSAGDVNGDEIPDVLIGASSHTNLSENEGAAYLFFGSSIGLNPTPSWLAYGGSNTASFGSSVAAAGDVNGDGFDDVIIGAPGYDLPDREDCGVAFIFLGSATGLQPTPAWSFYGEVPEARFGYAVNGAGKVNNDRFDDFLVGAPYHSGLIYAYEGAAYLFLGDEFSLSTTPQWTTFGGQLSANLGISLAPADDLNQDGFADVAIGAYQYTDDHSKEGRTYVYYGSDTGLVSDPFWWADGNKAEATFGQVLGGGGDLNRDGFLDLVVGAPGYRIGEIIVGRALVFLGIPEAVTPSVYKKTYLPVIVK